MCNNTMPGNNNSSKNGSNDDEAPGPLLCHYWCRVHATLPRCTLFGMDFSLTIATALFLASVRFTAEYVQVHVFDWPANSFATKIASTSVASIAHSATLVPALWACFAAHPYNPSASLNTAPLWYQKSTSAILQFCTGYMLYDGLLNVLWLNWTMNPVGIGGGDAVVFGGHHIACALYMTMTRVYGAGHQSAMICMLLGEITNPFHNAYYIATAALALDCCNGSFSQQIYMVVEFLFASTYFVARAVIAPVAWTHLTYRLWWNRNPKIPVAVLVFWTVLIWGVEIGSLPYIQDCWNMTLKYLTLPGSNNTTAAEL
jgi:hypothetical protein